MSSAVRKNCPHEKVFRAEMGTIALHCGEKFERMAPLWGGLGPSKRHDGSLLPTRTRSLTSLPCRLLRCATSLRSALTVLVHTASFVVVLRIVSPTMSLQHALEPSFLAAII